MPILGAIRRREILTIAANTPELVRQHMQRLHADPDFVLSLKHNGVAFDPQGLQERLSAAGAGAAREGMSDLISDHSIDQNLLQIGRQLGRQPGG